MKIKNKKNSADFQLVKGPVPILMTLFIVLAFLFIPLFQLTDLPLVNTVQAATLVLPAEDQPEESCSWVQVNDGAFGLGGGPDGRYSGEEGFETLVFSDRLYLGMEWDSAYGARLWRTKSAVQTPGGQEDWEEVIADASGYPFGVPLITQNDHIDSLAEFNGYLYASTANGGSNLLGTRVFRSLTGDPGSWEDALAAYGAGFGSVYNTNFKDMVVYNNWLCGGTQNWDTGTQVWCSNDGVAWIKKNKGGFGNRINNMNNVKVYSGYTYDQGLYFGVQNVGENLSNSSDDVAKLFRTTSLEGTPTWIEVFSGAPGSRQVDILGEVGGYLYIATESLSGIRIYRSPSADLGSWSQVNLDGMDGDPSNTGTVADGAVVYNDELNIAVSNLVGGFKLWRTSGNLVGGGLLVEWVQTGANGLGDANNVYSQLSVFNGEIYAWTSNYSSGQQVLRYACSFEPSPTPTEPVCMEGKEDCQSPGSSPDLSHRVFLPLVLSLNR